MKKIYIYYLDDLSPFSGIFALYRLTWQFSLFRGINYSSLSVAFTWLFRKLLPKFILYFCTDSAVYDIVFLKTNAVYTYEIAILIGFAHIVPANFRCTSGTCTFIEL